MLLFQLGLDCQSAHERSLKSMTHDSTAACTPGAHNDDTSDTLASGPECVHGYSVNLTPRHSRSTRHMMHCLAASLHRLHHQKVLPLTPISSSEPVGR